jgi:FkbM family methyltransferase
MKSAIRVVLARAIAMLPLKRGQAGIAHTRVGKWLTQGLPATRVRLRSGAQLVVNPREFIGRTIALTGDYDAAVTDICTRVLRAGDDVIDIGGHCGVITFSCAAVLRRLGATASGVGRVHVFEPNPMMFGLLKQTLASKQVRNVTLHTCALSDKAGTFNLHLPGGSECEASLEDSAARSVGERPGLDVLVQVKEAGSTLAGLGLSRVRLLKIDVEGHESAVLHAAENFLRSCPPDIVVFESHTSRGAFFDRGEVRTLQALGYCFYAVERRLFSFTLRAIRSNADVERAWYDFVAVAPTAEGDEALSRLLC